MSVEFVREHQAEDFNHILAEIQRKSIPNNFDRNVAGHGRSQAFGVIRRWSYRPWLSRNTWQRPQLWALLLDFARKYVSIEWDAVQVNEDYQSAPHYDKGNSGDSYIVAFGDYIGGDLVAAGTSYNIRHRGHLFNGSRILHSTTSWTGHRYSLVFFKIEWPTKFLPRYKVSCKNDVDGMEISDEYDESIVVVDKKGHLVRTIKEPKPVQWIGRLTSRGQRSRLT